ncbi:MAG TPA: hypothetical protein VKY74_07140, partial [Chloroflexia bacterium]|nr:hypothetical protein [Chloroflexia bacterium]
MIARLRAPLALATLLAILTAATVFAVYRFSPAAWTVDVGGPLSGPLVVTGFYADEAEDAGRYHDRWTKAHAELELPKIGAGAPVIVSFRAASPRPAGAPPAVVTLTVGSRIVSTYTLRAQPAIYQTPPLPRPAGDPDLRLGFDSRTFRPSGDARDLGLKLAWVRVEPVPGAPPPDTPELVVLDAILSILGLYSLLVRLGRRPILAGLGAV